MLSSALNIGASGLRTMQAAVDNHSRNLANANTPGYRRRDTLLSEQPGGGVTWTTVHRFDAATAARLSQLAGEVGASDALAQALTGAQAQLSEASSTLADAHTALMSALTAAAFAPDNATTRAVTAEKAASMARLAQMHLHELESRGVDARQSEQAVRSQAQGLLDELAMLNQTVLANGPMPELRDRQAYLGQELSRLVGGELRFADSGVLEFRIDGNLVLTATGQKPLPATTGGAASGWAQAAQEISRLAEGFAQNLRDYGDSMNARNAGALDANGAPGGQLFSMDNAGFEFVGTAQSLAFAGAGGSAWLQAQQAGELDSFVSAVSQLAAVAGERTRVAMGLSDASELAWQRQEGLRQEQEGVDMDAEILALKNAQRAYEANAKVIQIADAMLGTLLSIRS